MSETKTILNIDSPTHAQTKRALDTYRKDKKSTIYKPEQCGGCGETLSDFSKVKYFGEYFCANCVGKWVAGER